MTNPARLLARPVAFAVAAASVLGALCILALIAHVSLDVAMRFLFDRPLGATILYVSAYYMVAIAFLGLGRIELADAHITVELLTTRMPAALRGGLHGATLLLTGAVALALSWRGWEEALRKMNAGAFTIEAGEKILTWPSWFLLPLGFGLFLLAVLVRLARWGGAVLRGGLAAGAPQTAAAAPANPAEGA